MREMVTVQIGQAGNQIGRRLWLELVEEAMMRTAEGGTPKLDAAASAFFRNVEPKCRPALELALGSEVRQLRARAVLIDSEEGVISETARDRRLGALFEAETTVTAQSGAGNNWAQGYCEYGRSVGPAIEEATRAAVEACESPQGFVMLHSVGGGTGSGLGSHTVESLADLYPELGRFCVPVYPSGRDDVVTSPYNAALSTRSLIECADCVVPIDNAALAEIAERSAGIQGHHNTRTTTKTHRVVRDSTKSSSPSVVAGDTASSRRRGFDAMNDVAAQFLSDLTAGARYRGSVNMDFNDIATNLVPYPRLSLLTASFAPCVDMYARETSRQPGFGRGAASPCAGVDRLFDDATAPRARLFRFGAPRPRALAAALLARGDVNPADVDAATNKLRPKFRLPPWNVDGFKIGLCDVPPRRAPRSVLCLCNATDVVVPLADLRSRFAKLYDRRAMVHHYTTYLDDPGLLDAALHDLDDLIHRYTAVNTQPTDVYEPPPLDGRLLRSSSSRLRKTRPSPGTSPATTPAVRPAFSTDVRRASSSTFGDDSTVRASSYR